MNEENELTTEQKVGFSTQVLVASIAKEDKTVLEMTPEELGLLAIRAHDLVYDIEHRFESSVIPVR